MQKISVDLIRLAVSGAVICAVVGTAELGALRHSDQLANVKTRIAPPIHVNAISVVHVKAISVGAPASCRTIDQPIGASVTQEARTERAAIAQSCSSVAPTSRRRSEPQSRLALAP
jgi:hypothetical protein